MVAAAAAAAAVAPVCCGWLLPGCVVVVVVVVVAVVVVADKVVVTCLQHGEHAAGAWDELGKSCCLKRSAPAAVGKGDHATHSVKTADSAQWHFKLTEKWVGSTSLTHAAAGSRVTAAQQALEAAQRALHQAERELAAALQ
eukprot:SAG25_NODE_7233_length_494_cov_0.941772_1_plen_140_part_01